ncbi:hypothetical protein OF820_13280 [Oceanotoga sp. DSM 15011]|jgi:hypothetical protein|uniref:Uncharacterized protein n=1 Tax=Oceanotoga teriensis TaxID=515440 RepID=A0AA45HJH3_9BACT|nr:MULTISPECIES: hypothetical protein [Oceanotoga]MDN5342428.1 hypothetical protein [Oceanotoga sp.]MDO7975491.1 hypothetical protein [Oceanotoga teriensis]PWJ96221.1 hypothetical protein C7380_102135 [Oceanotoga teriensis]UYP00005.1 hypothetical protein OF820_13280 [Oceanotoga sp. DSM 15011]
MIKFKNLFKSKKKNFSIDDSSNFNQLLDEEPELGEKIAVFYRGIRQYDISKIQIQFEKNPKRNEMKIKIPFNY